MDVRANIENGIQAIYQQMESRQKKISSNLEITEGDYFTRDKLIERINTSQALKKIQSEALSLQADLSNIQIVIHKLVLPLLERIADTTVEMDSEKEYPNNLTAKLLNFLLNAKLSLGQELSFDNLFISINAQLDDKTFREALEKLLLEPLNEKPDSPAVGTYIGLVDQTTILRGYIRNGIKHKYSIEFTEKGIELIQGCQLAAAHADELLELKRIYQQQHEKLKLIEEAWQNNEAQFELNKQEIIKHFSESKTIKKYIFKKLNEIAENIKDANTQSANTSEASCRILDAYVIVNQKILENIKKVYNAAIKKYGNARGWIAINEKIEEAQKNIEELIELSKEQRIALDLQIKQKKLQLDAMEIEPAPVVIIEQQKPVTLIPQQPDEDEEAVKFYYEKTCHYSQDLSDSMKKNLLALKKTALWGELGFPDSIDFALSDLKSLFDMKNDTDPDSINRRKVISEKLEIAKHVGLKEGLEKYNGIVTKVLDALGNPNDKENYAGRRANFINVLRHKDTQLLIEKHRDNRRFIHFVRECGINFLSMFGKRARSYGIMLFSPRSAQYSKSIEQEEQVRYAKRPRIN